MTRPLRAHLSYLKYVLRHKWYVFIECATLELYWRGLIHDWHKLLPSEWIPYVAFFYDEAGQPVRRRDDTGYYKPVDTGNLDFDLAWLKHVHRCEHHWQCWVVPGEGTAVRCFPIPEAAMHEMIADWFGAALAQGKTRESVLMWYKANSWKMHIHAATKGLLNGLIVKQVSRSTKTAR